MRIFASLTLIALLKFCPTLPPNPQPTPTPTPEVTPTPEPTPTPTPNPTPQPTPTPIPISCPAVAPQGSKYITIGKYGNGYNVSPRVHDRAYCEAVTGIDAVYDCKANPEGPKHNRQCDTDFLKTNCPYWERSLDGQYWKPCLPNGEGPDDDITCDHFDHWSEGTPYTEICDVNSAGNPISGFFSIAHGQGFVRACDKDYQVCSDAISVNF
jgi:hypothetical protein